MAEGHDLIEAVKDLSVTVWAVVVRVADRETDHSRNCCKKGWRLGWQVAAVRTKRGGRLQSVAVGGGEARGTRRGESKGSEESSMSNCKRGALSPLGSASTCHGARSPARSFPGGKSTSEKRCSFKFPGSQFFSVSRK